MAIGLVLGALLAAQPAMDLLTGGAGTSPVSVHPLAANEVLLELSASGTEYARADTATLKVGVTGRGRDEAAARAERDAIIQRIRNAARAAGVAAGDLVIDEAAIYTDLDVFDVEEPPPPEAEAPLPDQSSTPGSAAPLPPLVRVQLEPPRRQPASRSTVTISLREVGRLDSLQAALKAAGGELSGQPDLRLSDDTSSRMAARAKALARARADADAYAAALDMRVVRIARVTERAGFDFMTMMVADMSGGASRMRNMFETRGNMVPSIVFVGVDFVLAPR
jgi:uncharacterized protein YggE